MRSSILVFKSTKLFYIFYQYPVYQPYFLTGFMLSRIMALTRVSKLFQRHIYHINSLLREKPIFNLSLYRMRRGF